MLTVKNPCEPSHCPPEKLKVLPAVFAVAFAGPQKVRTLAPPTVRTPAVHEVDRVPARALPTKPMPVSNATTATPVGFMRRSYNRDNDPVQTVDSIRHDWALDEIEALYTLPLPELVFAAQTVHRAYHDPLLVQGCALLSVKTGGCAEDCAYCPQSSRYETGVGRHALLSVEETLIAAEQARDQGATRFCVGAAWRSAPRGAQFDRVLEMVRGVRALGLEACCTLGMLTADQADALAEAGLTAYNHNLDTSPEYYGEIITTRTYADRLETLAFVRDAGVTVCCGGVLPIGGGAAPPFGL